MNEIKIIEDIINRGIPSPEEIQKRNAKPPPVKISDAAHFIELLQTLLYIKGVSLFNKVIKPNLTIVISCWDNLDLAEGIIPSELLKEKLPLLYYFVENSWDVNSLSILGLSSTEKSLTDEPDEEYIDRTPIDFGYIIDSKGVKEKDLTLSIGTFIGRE